MLIPERIRLWREDAAVLRRRGARRAAALLERVAAELEDDLTQPGVQPELLTLANAVEQSGYTRGHLRRLLVAGTLTNHGTEDRPLVAASDPDAAWVQGLVYAMVLATVVSGADYFLNFRRRIEEARERMVHEAVARERARTENGSSSERNGSEVQVRSG